MFFFARRSYVRENMYKQALRDYMEKQSDNPNAMVDIQNNQLGFEWDPQNLIPAGMNDIASVLPATPVGLPTSSSSSTALPLPLPNISFEGWDLAMPRCAYIVEQNK